MAIKSATVILSALGTSPPWALDPQINAAILPGLLCSVSSGATLTYSIEMTGDNVFDQNWRAATGNWFPVDNLAALTASANGPLNSCCTAVRAHVTSYTSGSLTFSFCWAQL